MPVLHGVMWCTFYAPGSAGQWLAFLSAIGWTLPFCYAFSTYLMRFREQGVFYLKSPLCMLLFHLAAICVAFAALQISYGEEDSWKDCDRSDIVFPMWLTSIMLFSVGMALALGKAYWWIGLFLEVSGTLLWIATIVAMAIEHIGSLISLLMLVYMLYWAYVANSLRCTLGRLIPAVVIEDATNIEEPLPRKSCLKKSKHRNDQEHVRFDANYETGISGKMQRTFGVSQITPRDLLHKNRAETVAYVAAEDPLGGHIEIH